MLFLKFMYCHRWFKSTLLNKLFTSLLIKSRSKNYEIIVQSVSFRKNENLNVNFSNAYLLFDKKFVFKNLFVFLCVICSKVKILIVLSINSLLKVVDLNKECWFLWLKCVFLIVDNDFVLSTFVVLFQLYDFFRF